MIFNQGLWVQCYIKISLVQLDQTFYLRKLCKFFSFVVVQQKFICPFKFGLQIIHYNLSSSQPLLVYEIFSYTYFMRLRDFIHIYVCSYCMACPLYSKMKPFTIRVGILSCASWKHMDYNFTHGLFWSLHFLGSNDVNFRGNCIISV